jgi:hypothetical protein
MKWLRYRFKTKSVDDCRPLIFNPKYPWWISGETEDSVIIIAYLPEGESLNKYWDDAEIDFIEKDDKIIFTDRFSKPDWFKE